MAEALLDRENDVPPGAQSAAGSAEAGAALLSQYDGRIYRLALNLTGNAGEAEDILEEVFLRACTKPGQHGRELALYAWLVRMTVRASLSKVRQRPENRSLTEPEETAWMPKQVNRWEQNPEHSHARADFQAILDGALGELAPLLRAVFLLRDVEQFSTEDVAAVLGLSGPVVKALLSRARLELRERLNPHFRRA